jgi:hypothetical protein
MCTLLAFILMVLNTISLTFILSLAFGITDVQYSLSLVKIVAIISYIFILSFLSSFCLTENECCECCCPADKCCLVEKKPNKQQQQPVSSEGGETNNGGQKQKQDCCDQCCDCIYDCLFIPVSSCIRRIGKQGSRYFSVIFLALAHGAMIALCFYAVSRTSEKMNTKTIVIVVISAIIIVANIIAMVAPCFNSCEKLRYKEKEKKGDNKENKINDEYKNDANVVNVKNALDVALIENKQNNVYNNENNYYQNNQDFQEKIENTQNTNSNINKNNNVSNDFGKVFGINKSDANIDKKVE